MKSIRIIAILSVGVLTSFSSISDSSYQKQFRASQGKLVTVKCHVTLSDGSERIKEIVGAFKETAKAKKYFQTATVKSAGKRKRLSMDVHECVMGKDKFTKQSVRALDKNTAR